VDSKLSRTDLVGLPRKLASVIGLVLFNCNRLGLDMCPCPLPYIKRGRAHPLCQQNMVDSPPRGIPTMVDCVVEVRVIKN
jgi:hypothetical protein